MFLRKIPTIFLAVVMMISVLTVFPVSAEEARIMMLEVEAETNASTLSTSPVIYNAGDEIKISVRVSQNTGITGLMLYMEYDEKALEAVEDKCSATGLLTADDFLNHYVSKSGDAYFTFFSESDSTVTNATGVLAELTFIAKEVCAVDTAVEVTLFQNNPGFCVSGGDEVPFVSESGRFSIHGINADEGLVTAPTCTEGGFTAYVCEACGEAVVGNYTQALGHRPGEAVEENRVEPTCTEDGSYDSVVYCTVCESEISRETVTIGAVGHDLHDIIAKAPTCTEAGWNAYQACRREGCGYSTYQELPASGHRFGEPTVYEPNYHQEGYSVHTCIVCAYEERYDFVPALELLPGDVNGDGKITQTDYLLLKRAILKLSPLPEEFAAAGDFDGDGKTTAADYLLLKRYILFGKVDASSLE